MLYLDPAALKALKRYALGKRPLTARVGLA
jgi:hypothetical protein